MGAEDASLWLLHVQKHVGDVKGKCFSLNTKLAGMLTQLHFKRRKVWRRQKTGQSGMFLTNAKSDLPHSHPAGYMLHATALHHRSITIKQTRIFKKQNFSFCPYCGCGPD